MNTSSARKPTVATSIWPLAILAGFAYGAVDQYLGSLRPMLLLGSWTPTVGQMSAPWLLLPSVLGATQARAPRAAALGLATTHAALVGYFAMTLSPWKESPPRVSQRALSLSLKANAYTSSVGPSPARCTGCWASGGELALLAQRRYGRWRAVPRALHQANHGTPLRAVVHVGSRDWAWNANLGLLALHLSRHSPPTRA
jgi:hypothetical protein